MSNFSVSVVIPALNEAANVESAVNSAKNAGAFEVIVVDGGSRDATCEIAVNAGATVLKSGRGRAVQQNCGAIAASGDILLFLHADCRLSQDCIQQIQDAVGSGRVEHGAFCQVIDDRASIYRWLEWGNCLRIRWLSLPYGDQGIWVRRNVFETIGRFPEVSIMEDVKLSESLRDRSRPKLLDGPIHVGVRRWQTSGPIRQTLRNWILMVRYKMGVPPDRLTGSYPHHDA